jgi:hypothetical protein
LVVLRIESLRQNVEHFRMRVLEAYDRRFNGGVPFE